MAAFTRRDVLRLCAGAALGGKASSLFFREGAQAATGPATVHAVPGSSLYDLYGMGIQAAQRLGMTGSVLAGKSLVIKPNLVTVNQETYSPDNGECTKPEILVGIAEQCLRAGAARVSICEGGQDFFWDWKDLVFLQGNRIGGAANLSDAVALLNQQFGHRVELVCLNQENDWQYIPSCSDAPLMAQGLRVARRFCEADHIISVPVLKTHKLTGITGAAKNLIGMTPIMGYGGGIRYQLHLAYAEATCAGMEKAGIVGCVMDMLHYRKSLGKQDYTVIDASIGLEGSGPTISEGLTIDIRERSRFGSYFLLAGDDMVAADAVAAQVAAHAVSEVPQLLLSEVLGLGEIRNITLSGASLWDLSVPDWKKPALVNEWGVFATVPPSRDPYGTSMRRGSLVMNLLGGLLLPAALVSLLRRRASVSEPVSTDEGEL